MAIDWKLNIDGELYSRQHQSIVYALNKVLDSNKTPTSVDEYSMEYSQCCKGKIIGVIKSKGGVVLFSLFGFHLEIGIYRNGNYTVVLRTQYIQTSPHDAIRGVCDYNIKGETIIAWCNGVRNSSTRPCILNLDNLPFKSGINPTTFELNNPSEIGVIYLFPEMNSIPQLTDVNVEDVGGGLPTGAYFIALGYGINPYDLTNFVYISNPISIYTASTSNSYKDIVGSEPNEATTKSIVARVSDIDIKFKYINIAIIHKSNSVFTAYLKSEPIYSNQKFVTIDFLANLEKIDLASITENAIIYEKIHAITKLDRKLIVGKVKTTSNINYQKFANNIKVEYINDKKKKYYNKVSNNYKDSYKHNYNIVFEKGFMPNEVYALYIRLRLIEGSISEAFHIPGRDLRHNIMSDPNFKYFSLSGQLCYEDATMLTALPNGLDNVNPNVINMVKDDASISDKVRAFHTRDTSFIHNGRKYLGYWENQDELYPDNEDYDIADVDSLGNTYIVGDIRNRKVRHHKMPSLSTLANGIDVISSESPIIGLHLYDIKFPNEIKDKIVGYEILYAKRTFANSTIQGQSMLVPLCTYNGTMSDFEDNVKYYPITAPVFTGSFSAFTAPDSKFMIYPYDLLKTNAAIYASYISNQLVITHNNLLTGDTFATPSPSLLVNRTKVSSLTNTTDRDKIRKIINSKYIPNSNNEDTYVDNTYGQSGISLEIEHNAGNKLSEYGVTNSNQDKYLDKSYIVDLCMFKTNCYIEYFNQDLISCGTIYLKNASSIGLYSGDTFLGLSAYRVTTAIVSTFAPVRRISKFLFAYPIYTPNNIELRFEGDNKYLAVAPNIDRDAERIYPKLGGDSNDLNVVGSPNYPSNIFKFLDAYTQIDNFYGIGNRGYNFDFTSLNDIFQTVIFNIYNPRVDYFPNRVHVSNNNQTEALGLGWRKFLYDSYREMPADKGDITLLAATDDILYIQCEYGLFIDNPKDVLDAQNMTVGLQEATILSRRPKEVLFDDDGEIGCVNMFGAIVTKYGYCVIDSAKGSLYILREGIKDINIVDVTSYFKLYSPIHQPEVNIFYDGGLMLAYDNEYERLLICKKAFNNPVPRRNSEESELDKSFTLSYHLLREHFISFHSYIPDFIFGYKNKLYSIKNDKLADDPNLPIPENHQYGVIYTHNIPNTTGKFYRETINNIVWEQRFYRSIIDIMYHSFIQASPTGGSMLVGMHYAKILDSISWLTSTYKDGILLYDKTIDKVAVYNDSQCTGELEVINNLGWTNSVCGKGVDDTWYYNNLRDYVLDNKSKFMEDFEFIQSNINKNVKNWFDKSYFIGKFVVARLISEQPDLLVKIHDIYIDFEQNKR